MPQGGAEGVIITVWNTRCRLIEICNAGAMDEQAIIEDDASVAPDGDDGWPFD